MSSTTKRLEKISIRISCVNDKFTRNSLRAAEKYLTDLALRHIVEYIIELEGKNGTI